MIPEPITMCSVHLVADCARCDLTRCQGCTALEARVEELEGEIVRLRSQLPPTREEMHSWVKPADRKKPGSRS